MMVEFLQGRQSRQQILEKEIGWYVMSIIAKTRSPSRVSVSSPRPSAMSLANYQNAMAVSIGGLTSKPITNSDNCTIVVGTALHSRVFLRETMVLTYTLKEKFPLAKEIIPGTDTVLVQKPFQVDWIFTHIVSYQIS
jgi:hypothetical protein